VFKTVRGMRDYLPKAAEKMRYIEHVSREIARLYGYKEVITPVVESYDLLTAKSGEEIRERMYAFKDLGGRRVALRPEFTASIARLVATAMRNEPKPLKLFCVGSLYRYDEPQYGRYREFWQSNYELIGSSRPEADAEILILTHNLMKKLGLQNYHFKVGHVGVLRGILSQEEVSEEQQNRIMQLIDKKQWDDALALAKTLNVSEKCMETLRDVFKTKGKNVDQVLQKAKIAVQEYKSANTSVENLQEILELIQESGVKFETVVDMGFARGLEYYTGMIFEVYVPEMDIALGGGGRYDKLIELFGGEPTPAVGVAPGIDRIMLAMERQGVPPNLPKKQHVAVIPIDEKLKAKAIELSMMLREAGIPTEVEVMGRTVSKALSDADRRKVTHTVLVGPEEIKSAKVVLRDMVKREQKTVDIRELPREILGS